MNEKIDNLCLINVVESPQLSNPAKMGRASLCYLRGLPNTSEEIGRKN
jgi:hypothetical protein